MSLIVRRSNQAAWGFLRVQPHKVPGLLPRPGTSPRQGGAPVPVQTGGRPPAVTNPFNPCPAGAPQHTFAVSAIDSSVANTGGPQSTGGGSPGGDGGGGGGGDIGAI